MASVTGSRLAFFSSTVTADKVNVVLTTDGKDVAGKAIAGDFNIEVFTSTPGTLAAGFQGSAFIQGGLQLTNNVVQAGTPGAIEQLLDGSYTLIDLSGGSSPNESIQIVGSLGTTDFVFGSAGDTITGSSNPGVAQVIDATGTNSSNNPGPFQGPEVVFGGAGGTTVYGGAGDVITGGAGAMQVSDGTLAGGETVIGGAGNLKVFNIGKNFSITGSTGGTTFIDDTYSFGGGSSIVGGSGAGLFATGENTEILAASGDRVTVGSALTYVDASRGAITIQGGGSTVTGSPEGAVGYNTNILAGRGDLITLGAAATYINALAVGGAATITGGAGFTHVNAGIGTSITGGTGNLEVAALGGSGTIAGGSGNLFVFDIGTGEIVTGATAGTTFINDAYGIGGNSSLTGGSGTVTGAGGLAVNTEIIGAAGDTLIGGSGSAYLDAIAGSQSVVAGAGATTVQAGNNDTVTGGGGTLQAFLDSDQATTTVNLGASHGAASLRDVSAAGGAGSTISVTGFSTVTDVIQSSTSSGASLVATATKDGGGNVVLHFVDKSTMTLVGVTDATKITFTS